MVLETTRNMEFLRSFWAEERGQDLVEYSLLIALFLGIMFTVMSGGFPAINTIWTKTSSTVAAANAAAN